MKKLPIIVALIAGALIYPLGEMFLRKTHSVTQTLWDSTSQEMWPDAFERLQIPSSKDGVLQDAYALRSTEGNKAPLVVSLHTWSGNYEQEDPLAERMRAAGFNYIHPDFRGPNNTPDSCASNLAIQDIDDAIAYCIENMNVDTHRIYVVGVSGGGHATCATYFHSVHPISAFFAWVPITDSHAWCLQSKQRKLKYASDIEKVCGGSFDLDTAIERSPLMMEVPERTARLHLFAGINDGYTGSVPITHSVNLFNRLSTPQEQIDDETIIRLLSKTVEPTGEKIGEREIWHQSESSRSTLTIFEGGHEMLVDFAASQIINQAQQDAALNGAPRRE
jgi:hypothetical protein